MLNKIYGDIVATDGLLEWIRRRHEQVVDRLGYLKQRLFSATALVARTGALAVLLGGLRRRVHVLGVLTLSSALLHIAGCRTPSVSQMEKLTEFERAGPLRPMLDIAGLKTAQIRTGPYRVVPGDLLQFSMPAILQACTEELPQWTGETKPYTCRVDQTGAIVMPIVGSMPVAGLTLVEIEAAVAAAFYPRYVVNPPAVVAQVCEYRTAQVSIMGAVNQPGKYRLNSSEMSLVTLLMKAGGIVDEGAALIHIRRSGSNSTDRPIALPVKGLNIPFADADLQAGDSVIVERQSPQMFTVVGLVKSSGAFPYPDGVRYNLMQALAFAGGVNELAAPRYAKVYRQSSDGRIVSATFRLNGTGIVGGANVFIKPGDVVAVEQTANTRARLLLAQIFRVSTGVGLWYQP